MLNELIARLWKKEKIYTVYTDRQQNLLPIFRESSDFPILKFPAISRFSRVVFPQIPGFLLDNFNLI